MAGAYVSTQRLIVECSASKRHSMNNSLILR